MNEAGLEMTLPFFISAKLPPCCRSLPLLVTKVSQGVSPGKIRIIFQGNAFPFIAKLFLTESDNLIKTHNFLFRYPFDHPCKSWPPRGERGSWQFK
jgi:hypothetical protein